MATCVFTEKSTVRRSKSKPVRRLHSFKVAESAQSYVDDIVLDGVLTGQNFLCVLATIHE